MTEPIDEYVVQHVKFEVPQGAPTFTRKPQILQKTSDSGDPAIVFDIGFQADQNPEVIWLNAKGKKMKESSRIKIRKYSRWRFQHLYCST